MSKKRYTYEGTACRCHPENCCCPDYTIMVDGTRYIRVHHAAIARHICKALNAYEEEKK